jgi:hypothetical protein
MGHGRARKRPWTGTVGAVTLTVLPACISNLGVAAMRKPLSTLSWRFSLAASQSPVPHSPVSRELEAWALRY